eukprot:maker-scaffold1305_size49401-snap-gene-0.16 protein:Tk01698 transcript:maker-scaffold1305_size49401-snap-gene-0.16-mRNA-1 annotation:"ankyrin repeat domain 40"
MEEKLREAACFGDLDSLTTLLNKGADINAQHKINGWTALHWAVKRNNVQCVDILMSRGAEKNIYSSKGEIPAMLTTNREILLRLGVPDPTALPPAIKNEGVNHHPGNAFVPNYLRHPSLGHKGELGSEVGSEKSRSRSVDAHNANSQPGVARNSQPSQVAAVRILKLRLVGKEHFDADFIEVDMPCSELSFRKLIDVICEEFTVNPLTVLKVRKLPNTKLRRDVEVQRLDNYQEIEVEIADI